MKKDTDVVMGPQGFLVLRGELPKTKKSPMVKIFTWGGLVEKVKIGKKSVSFKVTKLR